MARGSVEAVIGASGLVTFNGEGPGIDRMAPEIARMAGVDSAVPFGTALHVSGSDRSALETALRPWQRDPFTWREVVPSLEDVFIQLMDASEDNFR